MSRKIICRKKISLVIFVNAIVGISLKDENCFIVANFSDFFNGRNLLIGIKLYFLNVGRRRRIPSSTPVLIFWKEINRRADALCWSAVSVLKRDFTIIENCWIKSPWVLFCLWIVLHRSEDNKLSGFYSIQESRLLTKLQTQGLLQKSTQVLWNNIKIINKSYKATIIWSLSPHLTDSFTLVVERL